MKKLRPVLFLMAVLVGLLSCKKDDKTSLTKTEMLTGKYWITTSMTVSPAVMVAGTPITDIWAQADACSKDDLQKFDTPNLFTADEGATKCDVNAPQTTTGTWSFNSDQTVISVTQGTDTYSYNIINLSESEFKASYQELSDLGAGSLNYTFTYTAQVK